MQIVDNNNLINARNEALASLEVMLNKIKSSKETSKRNGNLNLYKPLEHYMKASEQVIISLEERIKFIGKEKFEIGYHVGRKDESEITAGGLPNKYFDKEAHRAYHEMQVKNKWDNLF